MPEITLRHEIDTDEDTFWSKVLLDVGFNKKLFEGALKFPSWEQTEFKEDDQRIFRRLQIHPAMDESMPGPLRKALGDRFTYVEEGTLDKKAKRYSFKIIPSALTEKTKITGELWLEKVGEKKVCRVARVNVEVKVFVIGGPMEQRILADTRKGYDQGAEFTNRLIRDGAI